MRKILIMVLAICFASTAFTQEFKLGFKTGLTISKFDSPSEEANGMELESHNTTGGFMVGAIFGYAFTDLFGIKGELLYNQKGTQYNFTGPGYQILPTETGTTVFLVGDQRIDLNISTNYLDIPVMAYGRLGRFEFEGGVSLNVLLSSAGNGELEINGVTLAGASTGTFNGVLDQRYGKDDISGITSFLADDLVALNIDGQMINVPKILNAYYLFADDSSRLSSDRVFNLIDIGLVGGINYYWNSTLYLGARLNYGLLDVTNDSSGYDVSKVNLANGLQFDKDQNLSIQLSLGFSF